MSSSGWQPPASEPPAPGGGGWSSAPAPAPAAPPPGYPPPPGYGYPPPPPPYGVPTYGHAAYERPTTDGLAFTALALAIGSWACLPFLALVALPIASSAKQRVDSSGGMLLGGRLIFWARLLAVANLAVAAVALIVLVLHVVTGVTSAPS